jgi:hypothetical protein
MNYRILGATTLLVLGCVGSVLTAQQTTTTGSKRMKSRAPATITLKGCVAEATGHYMLNRAMVVEPVAGARAAAAPATPVVENSDNQVYELIGAAVKSHVGHQVEITGSTVDADRASADGTRPNDLKQTAHPMAGTIDVKAVKMLAQTCPS